MADETSRYQLYRARVNRYGINSKERLNNGRRLNFDKFLKASPHAAYFMRQGIVGADFEDCVLEPFMQDEKRTVVYFLCRDDVELYSGQLLRIFEDKLDPIPEINKTGSVLESKQPAGDIGLYMVWYWDQRKDSGYNRYALVKMTYEIKWTNDYSPNVNNPLVWNYEYGYVFAQENNMIKNELKSRSRSATLYLENLKLEFIIMPTNLAIQIGSYVELSVAGIARQYKVTGFDVTSTPGVSYVSMDPVPKNDLTNAPVPPSGQDYDPSDYFFLGYVGDDNAGK